MLGLVTSAKLTPLASPGMKRTAEDSVEQENGTADSGAAAAPAEEEKNQPEKKAKKATGEAVFTIGGKRKVSVNSFKGNLYVNIREFYDDKNTGEEKPGSKGIALTVDQWKSLVSQIQAISDAVNERSA